MDTTTRQTIEQYLTSDPEYLAWQLDHCRAETIAVEARDQWARDRAAGATHLPPVPPLAEFLAVVKDLSK